jgi:hypothetical protein
MPPMLNGHLLSTFSYSDGAEKQTNKTIMFCFQRTVVQISQEIQQATPNILRGIPAHSSLLGCEAVSLGEWFPMFGRNVLPLH